MKGCNRPQGEGISYTVSNPLIWKLRQIIAFVFVCLDLDSEVRSLQAVSHDVQFVGLRGHNETKAILWSLINVLKLWEAIFPKGIQLTQIITVVFQASLLRVRLGKHSRVTLIACHHCSRSHWFCSVRFLPLKFCISLLKSHLST